MGTWAILAWHSCLRCYGTVSVDDKNIQEMYILTSFSIDRDIGYVRENTREISGFSLPLT